MRDVETILEGVGEDHRCGQVVCVGNRKGVDLHPPVIT